jgi:uncharacterized protein
MDAVNNASPPDPAAGSGPGTPPAQDFCRLDPRVVRLWRIRHLVSTAVLLGLLLVPAVLVVLSSPRGWRWAAASWLAVALLRLWHFSWYPPQAYQAWGYRLDGRVLETRHGVWFRTVELLPLARLQHVDLHSGPIERSAGLASLILHTAGTHQATIVVPGLAAAEAKRLRDHLVSVGGDDGV